MKRHVPIIGFALGLLGSVIWADPASPEVPRVGNALNEDFLLTGPSPPRSPAALAALRRASSSHPTQVGTNAKVAMRDLAPAPVLPEPRLAFVIGNASYPDDDKPLRDPIKNARAVADELRRIGFEVVVSEDLTKEKARLAADAFKAKLQPGATVLLFFSGYGIQSSKQSYLIPIDARIWTESDVRRDGVGIDSILSDMGRAGAGVKIIIVDAARRNPFERRFRSVPAGLAALTAPPPDTLAIYSTAPDKVLSEGNDGGSLFVAELLKQMRVPDLSAEDIFNRTRLNVSSTSRNEQVPSVFSSLTEVFYFAAPSKQQAGTPEKPKAVAPPPVQPPPFGLSESEKTASASQVIQPPQVSSSAVKSERPLPPNTLLWWWPQWRR